MSDLTLLCTGEGMMLSQFNIYMEKIIILLTPTSHLIQKSAQDRLLLPFLYIQIYKQTVKMIQGYMHYFRVRLIFNSGHKKSQPLKNLDKLDYVKEFCPLNDNIKTVKTTVDSEKIFVIHIFDKRPCPKNMKNSQKEEKSR